MKIPAEEPEDESSNDLPPPIPADSGQGENGSNGNHSNHSETSQLLVHEEAMFAAIDAVCSSTEQTYNQFLECFSYFKPDDVYALSGIPSDGSQRSSTTTIPRMPSVLPSGGHVTVPENLVISGHMSHMSGNHGDQLDDELEEEILSVVTLIPDVPCDVGKQTKPIVKMDNFVDDEAELSGGDDDGDDDVGDDDDDFGVGYDPYSASFSHQRGEKSERNDPSSSYTAETPVDAEDLVEKSPDEEIPNENKSYSDLHVDRLPDPPPEVRYDSTGVPIVSEDSADLIDPEDKPSTDDLCYDPEQDRPNPGEITDESTGGSTVSYPTIHEVTNIRQMGYSAKLCDIRNESQAEDEVQDKPVSGVTDPVWEEVQTFSLDAEFDYDNVTLTPKYSAEDLKLIRLSMQNADM